MEEIKNQFHRELVDLQKLIAFYNSELKLLSEFDFSNKNANNDILNELSSNLKAFHISKRQFNYNSIIISLYGSFERFIENILISYADLINRLVPKYDQLPETIVRNHFNLSLYLLNKVQQPRYNGPLKKEGIISNLHTCINTNENYQLNKDAFAQHTANFRSQVIDENFAHLGIATISSLIIKDQLFNSFINSKNEKPEGEQISLDESFYFLNDLAERRNDVAHGVPSEILQNDILLEYVDFFNKYSEALTNVLTKQYLQHEVDYSGKELGDITDVFHDGTVICVYSNNIPIKTGDIIIGKNETTITKSRILTMQLDDSIIEDVDDQNNYELGLQIDNKFKKNFRVFLVPNT